MNDLDRALDEVFSLWIRCKGSWSCMTCPAKFRPFVQLCEFPDENLGSPRMLDCSHFWGKGSSGFWTRWNDFCAEPLCRYCHQSWEKMKEPGRNYYEFKVKQLGDPVFNFMDWLSRRVDPMYPQVKEFKLFELISRIGSLGYPTGWLFEKHGYLIKDCPWRPELRSVELLGGTK